MINSFNTQALITIGLLLAHRSFFSHKALYHALSCTSCWTIIGVCNVMHVVEFPDVIWSRKLKNHTYCVCLLNHLSLKTENLRLCLLEIIEWIVINQYKLKIHKIFDTVWLFSEHSLTNQNDNLYVVCVSYICWVELETSLVFY